MSSFRNILIHEHDVYLGQEVSEKKNSSDVFLRFYIQCECDKNRRIECYFLRTRKFPLVHFLNRHLHHGLYLCKCQTNIFLILVHFKRPKTSLKNEHKKFTKSIFACIESDLINATTRKVRLYSSIHPLWRYEWRKLLIIIFDKCETHEIACQDARAIC